MIRAEIKEEIQRYLTEVSQGKRSYLQSELNEARQAYALLEISDHLERIANSLSILSEQKNSTSH